jgi:hypothetical protein
VRRLATLRVFLGVLVSLSVASRLAPATPATLEARVLLIGDAGDATGGDPVLRALQAEAARESAKTVIVFLGDNVYPYGLPADGAADRREAEGRIRAQLDAARRSGARTVFVPGNHDWQKSGPEGWERVKRLGALVNAVDGVSLRPSGGCPGPEVVDFGEGLRLVLLDTQWWLHPGPRPLSAADGCPIASEDGVVAALRAAIDTRKGRRVVVAAHHPLRTGGPHGGRFGFKQHVFPLTEVAPWLWLPLPVVGSVYPLARGGGASDQDVSGKRYRRMRSRMEEALRLSPPLAWAAGHEHGLQVLRPAGGPLHLVSGAGTIDNVSYVGRLPETLFAKAAAGFVRLDLVSGGRSEVTVLGVSRDASVTPLFTETVGGDR